MYAGGGRSDERVSRVAGGANEAAERLRSDEVDVLGPVPQYISKIKDEYRWQITAKGKSFEELKKSVSDMYFEKRQSFEAMGVYINPRII